MMVEHDLELARREKFAQGPDQGGGSYRQVAKVAEGGPTQKS